MIRKMFDEIIAITKLNYVLDFNLIIIIMISTYTLFSFIFECKLVHCNKRILLQKRVFRLRYRRDRSKTERPN